MVWKQDLAKLKQAFREAGGPPPPPAGPSKPKSKPSEIKDLNDEDAVFLAAMGAPPSRPAPRPGPAPSPVPVPERPVQGAEAEPSFEASLADLKGLKPLHHPPVLSESSPVLRGPAPLPPPSPLAGSSAAPEAAVPLEAQPGPGKGEAPEPFPGGPARPLRIQLAAGMAVEVDAALDLRHHSVPDALGRLRDRIEDGSLLGWRTLHVVLGEDPALHEALLSALAGGALRIGRYAQAPIPMGGAHAWILYY